MPVNLKVLAIVSAVGGLIAAALFAYVLTRDVPRAETLVLSNGVMVAPSMRVDDAIGDASRRVGFDVRSPRSVPANFQLSTVGTNTGGSGGIDALWATNKVASLVYEDGQGQHISITQIPPELSTKLAAGAHPREFVVGAAEVMVSHTREDAVSVSGDSRDATYSAIYVFSPGAVSHAEAEQVLLDMLESME